MNVSHQRHLHFYILGADERSTMTSVNPSRRLSEQLTVS
jgi:hypothetical protein